jgi:hypothetical protein
MYIDIYIYIVGIMEEKGPSDDENGRPSKKISVVIYKSDKAI